MRWVNKIISLYDYKLVQDIIKNRNRNYLEYTWHQIRVILKVWEKNIKRDVNQQTEQNCQFIWLLASPGYLTHRNRNFDNLPNVSGMGPAKLFKYKSKLTKFVRFPRSLGIGPVMLLLYNSLSSQNKKQ